MCIFLMAMPLVIDTANASIARPIAITTIDVSDVLQVFINLRVAFAETNVWSSSKYSPASA